ncbi:MAG: 30S ribosomal protein S12 methylthiotransferase RimO [Erysipelotrichaceae bacterium]|nr:30S ribosomal protein S12 methylthiotransferase RimO [Erysipelotrichaceae bacterium]
MKIGIVSLGCSKNLIDTQTAMKYLAKQGHSFTSEVREADVIIVNTCAFINDAKQESINTILEMADYKEYNCQKLIVMGCLAQRYRNDLEKAIPEVDRFITIDEYGKLEEILSKEIEPEGSFAEQPILATKPWTAYLRISDGCNNRCAFCAIPGIRGRYKSVPMEDLLKQRKQLEQLGIKELNLIAQDTSRYGYDIYHENRLLDLLRELNNMDFHWIRVLYLYPDLITKQFLLEMKKLDKVLPYFDMPVQHGSDRLLKAMRRITDSTKIRELTADIREVFPDATLRTTVMVGFPSENREDFKQLINMISEVKWDHLGAFKYSREENTEAYDMKPVVAAKTKQNRLDKVMTLQRHINAETTKRYIGQEMEVLIEGKDAIKNLYIGRNRTQAPDDIDGHTIFTADKYLETGTFARVRITAIRGYDMYGEAV